MFKIVTCVGFWKYTSQKDLVYVSTQPREDFNNKKLVCSAHHGAKAFKRVKTSVMLKIECKYNGVNCKFTFILCFIQCNCCSTSGNRQKYLVQWRIQDFPEGAPTYYLVENFPKTA